MERLWRRVYFHNLVFLILLSGLMKSVANIMCLIPRPKYLPIIRSLWVQRQKYKDGWVEVATFGIYSPSALSQYNIPYPVMNLGMGVERLAMILHDSTDVRALVYPQFQYKTNWVMSDSEIASMIFVEDAPVTGTGKEIQDC